MAKLLKPEKWQTKFQEQVKNINGFITRTIDEMIYLVDTLRDLKMNGLSELINSNVEKNNSISVCFSKSFNTINNRILELILDKSIEYIFDYVKKDFQKNLIHQKMKNINFDLKILTFSTLIEQILEIHRLKYADSIRSSYERKGIDPSYFIH